METPEFIEVDIAAAARAFAAEQEAERVRAREELRLRRAEQRVIVKEWIGVNLAKQEARDQRADDRSIFAFRVAVVGFALSVFGLIAGVVGLILCLKTMR